jgi:uncharacterized linocin/CFP29 family protein
MDILNTNGLATGSVAQKLAALGMRTNALRPYVDANGNAYISVNGKAVQVSNATLRKDEWEFYDDVLVRTARERMIGTQDLIDRGLTFSTPGLSKTVLETENVGEFTPAELSMDGISRSKGDRPNFEPVYLPLPIIHKDFALNARTLAASRQTGEALDATGVELATRQAIEKSEDLLFTGSGQYSFGGGTIYGYSDFPSRNTGFLSADWATATGEQILTDVLAMKASLNADGFYGPFVLYVPTTAEAGLDKDFKAASDKSVRQRLLEINMIDDIKVADKLAAQSAILVQMTSDVVRLVSGMPWQVVEWSVEGGMAFNYKVMGIQVPQLRADQAGKCGIAHYTVNL